MSQYAAGTSVPVERSKAEIEGILLRRGAGRFISGFDRERAQIGFELNGRVLRFEIPLPDRADAAYTKTPGRRKARSPADAMKAWEQDCRRRWRALAAVIKAKFIAIDDGVSTFDVEFLPYIVLPGGTTVGAWAVPQIAEAYKTKKMPPLIAGGSAS